MPIAVELPALSPTMEEGKITKWLKNEGDKVSSGMAIAECETDKANLEIEATESGILLKIVVPAGESAPVGATIAWIGKAGEAIPEVKPVASEKKPEAKPEAKADAKPEAKPEAKAEAKPEAKAEAKPEAKAEAKPEAKAEAKPEVKPEAKPEAKAEAKPEAKAEAKPEAKAEAKPEAKAEAKAEAKPEAKADSAEPASRVLSSPLARKLASERGLEISDIAGSGPSGRIVKRDVEGAKKPAKAFARHAVGERLPPEELELSTMQKVIAKRLAEVKPGVPHFYLTVDIEMDEALKIKADAAEQGLKLSANDIVVKATAVAVRRFPRINQVFLGDHIQQLRTVDVGIAVAIEDGLITPVVRDADQLGLAELSATIRELGTRAKKRALKPEEYTGGSITVSNLGMFGIDSFIAVINPPQSAILAIGRAEPKPVVRGGEVVVRQMMSVTLSGDHRVIDGAVGAQYLVELKQILEHPLSLLY